MKSNKKLGLLSHLSSDLPAGLVVFFVALPLCLGIALASGAPPFSGIIAGVVGGLIVGSLSNSSLGVSGPAAGLAVIVLDALTDLGALDIFLVAVVIAGVIQIILGLIQGGIVASFFPSSVIKGMLSAIGIVIILKQIPHAFGYDYDAEGEMDFIQSDGQNTFSELLNMFNYITPSALIVTGISLFILLLWDLYLTKKSQIFSIIQGSIVVVVLGILFQSICLRYFPEYAFVDKHLVNVPVPKSSEGFWAMFTLPKWSVIYDPRVWSVAAVLAIVASLETLLSVEATDKLDPLKRITNPNRELIAQGCGNMVSGMIGGLPITQVIVRSSANVQSGGKTKLAGIFHGFLLLTSVLLFPGILNMIPLSALACILILVGYKLAKPSLFYKMYQSGWQQFIPYTITVIAIVFTNLIIGLALGLAIGIFILLRESYLHSHLFKSTKQVNERTELTLTLAEEVTFMNKIPIQKELLALPPNSHLTIDMSKSVFIDDDIIELFENFKEKAKEQNIELTIFRTHKEKIMRTQTKETQSSLTAKHAYEILKAGNERFVENLKANRNLLNQVNETSEGQFPFAVILSCIDSRTSAELIFDQGLGDIFSIRIAGNFVNEDILGSMEFACKVAGSKLILVLGHTRCGAIKGACDDVKMGNLTNMLSKIKPAVEAVKDISENRNSENEDFVNRVTESNVHLAIEKIYEGSPILKEMADNKEIAIIGGVYSVETGKVEFQDLPF